MIETTFFFFLIVIPLASILLKKIKIEIKEEEFLILEEKRT